MLAYLHYFLSLWLLYGISLFCGTVVSLALLDPNWVTGRVSYYVVPLGYGLIIAGFFGAIGSLIFEALRWIAGRYVSLKKTLPVYFAVSLLVNPFIAVKILPEPIMYLPLVLTSLGFTWLYRRTFEL